MFLVGMVRENALMVHCDTLIYPSIGTDPNADIILMVWRLIGFWIVGSRMPHLKK